MNPETWPAILQAGAAAPSYLNNQPWRVRVQGRRATLSTTGASRTSVIDQAATMRAFALGAFVHNAARAAHSLGHTMAVQAQVPFRDDHAATLTLTLDTHDAGEPFVPARSTNRFLPSTPPFADEIAAWTARHRNPPWNWHVASDPEVREALGEIFAVTSLLLASCAAFIDEQNDHVRPTPEQAKDKADGLDLRTLHQPGPMAPEQYVAFLQDQIVEVPHVICLSHRGPVTATEAFAAGAVFVDVWETAQRADVGFHPFAGLCFLMHLNDEQRARVLDGEGREDFAEVVAAYRDLMGFADDEMPIFQVRASRGAEPPVRALRRPVAAFATMS